MTVTDNNSNVSTCTATITVEDNVNPVAICQNLTVQLDATGAVSITATQVDNGSSDACGIASMTLDETNFDCTDVGANTVTMTVTDNNSNVSTCTATITVEDTMNPNAICQDLTLYLDATGAVSITADDVDNGSSDNCAFTKALNKTDFACSDVGANTVTMTLTDASSNFSTCTATVTVQDTVSPVAVCQDLTVQLDATGAVSITADDVDNGSSDACGIATMTLSKTDFACSDVGANTVTMTVTDNNSNVSTCTATITVEDNVNPVAICQNLTVQLDATGAGSITAAQVDNGSSDNCGIASMTLSQTAFDCTHIATSPVTITMTVTDNNSNVSTCTAAITVEDNVSPTAICQDLTVYLDATGAASITADDVDNGSSDNCAFTKSLNKTDFACSDVGANTVTMTLTDASSNVSTCTATVTVQDTVSPVVVCQDLTVQLDATGAVSITADDVDNGSSDACGIATMTLSKTDFACSDVGANTVTMTVTDNNSNVSTCTATITVEDDVNPRGDLPEPDGSA